MQFSIRDLFVGTAFVAVALGGMFAAPLWMHVWSTHQLLLIAAIVAPCWTPLAVAAFALGQRSLTLETVLVLVAMQAAACVASFFVYKNFA